MLQNTKSKNRSQADKDKLKKHADEANHTFNEERNKKRKEAVCDALGYKTSDQQNTTPSTSISKGPKL